MSEKEEITTLSPPLSEEEVKELKAGDMVKITGTIITARDKAYARILEFSRAGKELPADLEGGVVYHCGPLVKKTDDEWEIISAGPTTSARLDDVQTEFVENTGVRVLIGKGGMSQKVAEEVGELGCIYLAFTGGAGALAADAITSIEDLVWEDLGTAEGIWVLKVKEFGPLLVAIDMKGGNLYEKR
ncbi:fumarate hydratase [candidate division MSBL1 archaeon SCGC-AAA261O19]|uniref:Fumarate hydratase n=1 Tax=candidate division MSBL1 archaeon SCGC-AAA261O19 TaxID=1698277 RepID=A0A133VDN4_9EURY|nr:fumarate hydratase [candidate division MSBL1 archaeon SCGC-AAA261O19]